jgi:hypothetical protein
MNASSTVRVAGVTPSRLVASTLIRRIVAGRVGTSATDGGANPVGGRGTVARYLVPVAAMALSWAWLGEAPTRLPSSAGCWPWWV